MLKIFLVVFFVAAVGIDVSNSVQTPWGSQVRKAQSQRYTGTGSNIVTSKATLQPSYFHLRSKSSPANLEDAANYVVRPNAPSIASTSRPTSTQPDCPVLFNAVRQFFASIHFIAKWHIDLHNQFLGCLRDGNRLSINEANINYCSSKVYGESEIHEELKALKKSVDYRVEQDICYAAMTYHLQTYDYRDRRPLGGYVQTLLLNCPGVRQTTFSIPRVAANADDSNAPSPEPMRVGRNNVPVRRVEEYLNFQEFVKKYNRENPESRVSYSNVTGRCAPRNCIIQ